MSTARVIPFTSDSLESTAVMERYRKAYQTAERMIDFAENVRFSGMFLAGLVFIAALIVSQSIPAERSGFPVMSAWLVAGAVFVVLASHLWSVVFRVQGRMLEATVDLAVNSSPLLTTAERAQVISWPNGAATQQKTAA
jgi:uncharacterized membrane protein